MSAHDQQPNRPRIADVAALAGVSTATVSRALSNPDMVKAPTRDRIMKVISRLGYVPDGSGRALALGRGRLVGAVVPTLDNAIFAQAVQGLQTTLSDAGYHLLIASHEYDTAAETDVVRALLERAIDALVLVGADHMPQTWEQINATRIPCLITWTDRIEPADGLGPMAALTDAAPLAAPVPPLLGFDNRLIGTLAAEHLLALGHRHFGMISGRSRHNDRARLRIEGFRDTLAEQGIELPLADIVEQDYGFDGGRAGLAVLMSRPTPPTAIFCGNDVLAMGCLFAAQERGIAVPHKLSIVGCDNLPIASQITPALSTVTLPTYELGQRAASALLDWLIKDIRPENQRLPISLIARATSAAPG